MVAKIEAARRTSRDDEDQISDLLAAMSAESTEPGDRILIVEDDDLVRIFVVDALRAAGFETLEAPNADAAMEILSTGERIDLLCTDIMMPGSMTGIDLGKKAQTQRPDLKIVYMSGFPGAAALPNATTPFLSKPFRTDELVTKVHKLLDSRPFTKRRIPVVILLVDDHELERNVTSLMLAAAGYEVLQAGNAAEAIDIIFKRPDLVLLVTDVRMPGTDGIALAVMAKARRPELKILYVTAYGEMLRDQVDIRPGQWLDKPYQAGELRAKVEAALA